MSSPLSWIALLALCAVALLGLHRLGLWLDDRGWLYYRRSSRKGRWGLALAAAFDPNVRRILEIQESVKRDEDESGDPTKPRVRVT